MTSPARLTGERAELTEALRTHRGLFRTTLAGIDDEQAARRSTVSALCLGGLVKHVATVEQRWASFMVGGAAAMEREPVDWQGQFRMVGGDSLAGLLERYDAVAARTDELIATLDLDTAHELPRAPWFAPGATWSVRRVLLHLIAETSQHAGHADIIRESIDGARTMA